MARVEWSRGIAGPDEGLAAAGSVRDSEAGHEL
jgi:hypothetical protein